MRNINKSIHFFYLIWNRSKSLNEAMKEINLLHIQRLVTYLTPNLLFLFLLSENLTFSSFKSCLIKKSFNYFPQAKTFLLIFDCNASASITFPITKYLSFLYFHINIAYKYTFPLHSNIPTQTSFANTKYLILKNSKY